MILRSFAPLTQRLVALGLFLLMILLALQLILVPLIDAITAGRSSLADTRYRLARFDQLLGAPAAPTLDPVLVNQLVATSDQNMAATALVARLKASAARYGVTVTAAPVESSPGNPRLVQVTIGATGPRDAILRWIADTESAPPVVRLSDTELRFDASGTASLNGTARAIWMRGR